MVALGQFATVSQREAGKASQLEAVTPALTEQGVWYVS